MSKANMALKWVINSPAQLLRCWRVFVEVTGHRIPQLVEIYYRRTSKMSKSLMDPCSVLLKEEVSPFSPLRAGSFLIVKNGKMMLFILMTQKRSMIF
jgi:hypothetical protein